VSPAPAVTGAGLRRAPFVVPLTTRFRRVEWREGVLVQGPAGWGEWSPFPEYGPPVAARWYAAAREAATVAWPAPVRAAVPVNCIVPVVTAERAAALVRAAGCTTAKVKVADPGSDPSDDDERLAAVRDALGPAGRIRIDANAAWDVDTAVARIRGWERHGLEYVEQPVATLAEMAAVRRRVDVPLAADESIRLAPDPLRLPGLAEAADLVVLKVQPLGGVWPALRVAEAHGLPAVVSSAVETSVGIAAGLALAAALAELPYACGLGTVPLLAADVVADPLVPVDGALRVRRPDVDPAALAAVTPDPAEAARLLARLDTAVAARGAVTS